MTPEQLKASILQRAMEGKLVPQDPNDEPASELLKRIKAEKEKLIKEGKIKRDKNETEIFRGDDGLHYEKFQDGSIKQVDVPFEAPESWGWVRFNNIATILRGGSPRPIKDFLTDSIDGINWIKIGDTEKSGKYITDTREKIKKSGLSKTRLVKKGSFLLTNSMSFGRPYILKIDGAIHDGWLSISDFESSITEDFLYYFLLSRVAYSQFLLLISGAVVKNLNSEKVASIFIPIPPLNEQARITQKIEVALSRVDDYHELFNTLRQLNNSFPEKLRKSILQYAMQGKLVSQDATDEPVEVLLKKIREEKQKLFAEGKLKKKDLQESIIYQGDDNSYYKMTDVSKEQWLVQRVKDIFRTIPTKKYQIKQSEILKEGLYPVVSQSKKLIEGYSSSKDKLYQHSKPIIVFGDHTRIVKLIDFDFVVGADGVKLMDPIYIDSEFGFLCLKFCCLDLKNRGYSRHYSHLQNMYVGIPDKNMQLRIVEKTKIIDKYINLLENKINKHI